MCLGMQRNTHITGNNLIPISVPTLPLISYSQLAKFLNSRHVHVTAIHKMNRDGYRDQIVTCDVGVSLHSKTHSLFMKYSNGTSTQCYAYHYLSLFPVLFLQSLYVPFKFFIYLLYYSHVKKIDVNAPLAVSYTTAKLC